MMYDDDDDDINNDIVHVRFDLIQQAGLPSVGSDSNWDPDKYDGLGGTHAIVNIHMHLHNMRIMYTYIYILYT